MAQFYKLVTIYRKVDEEQVLEEFFSGTHLPLAESLPGLVKSEVSRISAKPGGESRFHLMYELYFESQRAYLRAIASAPGQTLIQALMPWGEARIITWFYAESFEEAAQKEAAAQETAQEEAAAQERPDRSLPSTA